MKKKDEKYILTDCLYKVKQAIKSKEWEKATDLADLGIVYTLIYKDNGVEEEEEVEGVKLSLWKNRFWGILENNNLLRT